MNLPPYLAQLNVGGFGTDQDARLYRTGRAQFLPGGGGWPALVDEVIMPAIKLGAPGILLFLPHGLPGPGVFQAEPPASIALTHPLLVDNFIKAFEPVRALGIPVVYYIGGTRRSDYIHHGKTHRERLRRARECYQLCFDAGMILALDNDSDVPNNSDVQEIDDALAVFQPDPSIPQMIEALWGLHNTWSWDRPCWVLESTYQKWKKLGWEAQGLRDPRGPGLPPVYRNVDCDLSGDWLTAIRHCVGDIVGDGHRAILPLDAFTGNSTPFGAAFAAPGDGGGE
jgi:hypothetical protein